MDKFQNMLTDEEKEDVKKRELLRNVNITDLDLNLRKSIAQKFEQYINQADHTMSDEYKEIYEKYPRWCFYTDKKNKNIVRRAYGVCKYKNGSFGLHMVSCMIGLNNDVIGGVPVDTVEIIDEWQEDQLLKIQLSSRPYAFLDPLGWTHFIN